VQGVPSWVPRRKPHSGKQKRDSLKQKKDEQRSRQAGVPEAAADAAVELGTATVPEVLDNPPSVDAELTTAHTHGQTTCDKASLAEESELDSDWVMIAPDNCTDGDAIKGDLQSSPAPESKTVSPPRLHPKHARTLAKINEKLGGRGPDIRRSADVSRKAWQEAVTELTVFLRPGGPVPGGTQPTSVCLQLYTVVQRAVQSGPLGGAKPGYFNRKGLRDEDVELAMQLLQVWHTRSATVGLSEAQTSQVQKWLRGAEKRLGLGPTRVVAPPDRPEGRDIMAMSSDEDLEEEEPEGARCFAVPRADPEEDVFACEVCGREFSELAVAEVHERQCSREARQELGICGVPNLHGLPCPQPKGTCPYHSVEALKHGLSSMAEKKRVFKESLGLAPGEKVSRKGIQKIIKAEEAGDIPVELPSSAAEMDELVAELVTMGFPEDQAHSAVFDVGMLTVDAALRVLT